MPKQTPHIPLPGIQLEKTADLPFYRQIYEQLRSAILAGNLAPGTRLPSTRALARELGVSRTTIEEAYRDLSAEGYTQGQVGSGTHVVHELPETHLHLPSERPTARAKRESTRSTEPIVPSTRTALLSRRGMLLAETPPPSSLLFTEAPRPFRIGLPSLAHFPQQEWARMVARVARHASTSLLTYQDATGYRPLREEIATYLTLSRGVRCTVDQIIIVAGAQAGLSLVAQSLLNAQDGVWMEDPGYPLAKMVFQSAGATIVPVPIDNEGMKVAVGRALCSDARLAYVTPSHQFPLGVTMSITRRAELLSWAQESNAWIVEDDYDSEYRYIGRPIPALQGLDEANRVIYLGTFSKVLFPALRLGYLVMPPTLIESLINIQRTMMIHLPVLEQATLATFIAEGYFARHIRRMRSLYAEQGTILSECVMRYLGKVLTAERPSAGLHLVGWLPEGANDREMARLAERHGIITPSLSAYRMSSEGPSGVLLGYALFTEQEITEGIQRLARAWMGESVSLSRL